MQEYSSFGNDPWRSVPLCQGEIRELPLEPPAQVFLEHGEDFEAGDGIYKSASSSLLGQFNPQPALSQQSLEDSVRTSELQLCQPEKERWAVEVGKDTPRLLDHVLNEPEVVGGHVELFLIFVMTDVPCAMGIAFRVSEMESRVADIHERHIFRTVLNPLVAAIRRKRKRLQVQGHVEREDKVDTGLCEAAKRLKICRLVVSSKRGPGIRKKGSFFAEQCAKQLGNHECSIMVLQSSKKRTAGTSPFVAVNHASFRHNSDRTSTNSSSVSLPAAVGRPQSSGSWRSYSSSPPHISESETSAHGKPRSPPTLSQESTERQGGRSLLAHFSLPFANPAHPASSTSQDDSIPAVDEPLQQARERSSHLSRSCPGQQQLIKEDLERQRSSQQASTSNRASHFSRTGSLGALPGSWGSLRIAAPPDPTALRSRSEPRNMGEAGGAGVPRVGGRGSAHEGSLGSGSDASSESAASDGAQSMTGSPRLSVEEREKVSMASSGDRAPVQSLVHELRRLQSRLGSAHAEEAALKRSVEEAQDELRHANTQREEESLRRVACEAELEIAKFKAEEASRTVAMLQSEVEMARQAATEALAVAELAKNKMEITAERPLDFRMYTFKELSEATDGWSGSRLTCDGESGLVYRGTVEGHTPVAIRVLKDPTAPGALHEFQKEVQLGSGLRHPNLVVVMGCCMEPPCLVYEYMPQGSLHDRLVCRGGSPPLHWTTRFDVFWDVCHALIHLHCRENPIVHFDLKPSNILLDRNFVAKLGDVGLARIMRKLTDDTVSMPLGTLGYACPELLRSNLFCSRTDVFSLGMVLYDLLGGTRSGGRSKGLIQAMEEAVAESDVKRMGQLTDPSAQWPAELAIELAQIARECTCAKRRDRPEVAKGVMPRLGKLRPLVERLVQREVEETKRKGKRLIALAQGGREGGTEGSSAEECMPNSFKCPITLDIMDRPVIAGDGYTYEESAIEKWLSERETSPVTNIPLPHKHLIPNHNLRCLINDWKEQRLVHRPIKRSPSLGSVGSNGEQRIGESINRLSTAC